MEIRKTKPEEAAHVMRLYENARSFMAAHGNPSQWGTSYPQEDLILRDISAGNSYVCEEHGNIIAVFYYKEGDDPTYARIFSGQWLNELPYGAVHRITSDGTVKGTAGFCLDWAFRQCGNLKIDTHKDNHIMQHVLEKNGFTRCGIIFTEDGSERIVFQKAGQ